MAEGIPELMKITANGPDDLIAALPHVLGFHPQESMVLVPITAGLPVARIDLPRDEVDCFVAVGQLTAPFLRLAREGDLDATHAKVAVVCLTADGQGAAVAASAITDALSPAVGVTLKLWADARTWTDLDTGDSGPRTSEAASRYAAQMVASGRQMPARVREDLQRSLIGDRSPVAAAVPEAVTNWVTSTVDVERRWVENRVNRFLDDGIALSGPDAARLLVAAQALPVRDAAWSMMTQDEHHAHRALWTDLTRRAPDEVRTPAATLLAFSAWLGGDGAGAWTALDQIPENHQDYRLAGVMTRVLEGGVPPSVWTSTIRPGLLDEPTFQGDTSQPGFEPGLGPGCQPGLDQGLEQEAEVPTERPRRPAPEMPALDTPGTNRPPAR